MLGDIFKTVVTWTANVIQTYLCSTDLVTFLPR
jgi:hypothetical protein